MLTQLFTGTFTLGFNFRLRLGHDFSTFLFCLSFRFVQNLRAAFVSLLDDYLGFRFRFFQLVGRAGLCKVKVLMCSFCGSKAVSNFFLTFFDGCH